MTAMPLWAAFIVVAVCVAIAVLLITVISKFLDDL